MTAPAPGVRPAAGTPAPSLPATVRPVAAVIRSTGRTMRVEVNAPKGALVHVYRDGQLVTSVTPDEAKALAIPANGAKPEDVKIVVVTRTGEVMSTPVPPSDDSSTGAAPSSASPGAASSPTTAPNGEISNTTAPRRSAAGNRAGSNRSNNNQTTTSLPKNANTSPAKTGQRSTSDTVKPSVPTR